MDPKVAEIQPITIKGSVISRVTLHNIDYLQTMDIRPKDTVFVIKDGQVIPQILEVLTDQRPIDSQPVDIQESLKSQNINAQLVDNKWVGADLQALRIRRLVDYAKKLRIALLGPALITQLVHEGIVNEVIDLYNIQEKTLCANTYVGPKKAKQVVQNIQSTRQCQLKDWLVACGIPKMGPQTANLIAQNVYCFSDFQNLPTQKIKLTAQIGPTLAKSFCEWMSANPSFLEAFASFEFQLTPRASLVHKTLPLFGSVFVFTGKFNKITRAVATEPLTQLGGTVQSQINKKTHYIIWGDKPSKGKIEKAQNLTCKFFSEDDFITFFNAYEINSIT